MISLKLLECGYAALTGISVHGMPIVYFPGNDIKFQVNAQEVSSILSYYCQTSEKLYGNSRLVIVVQYSCYPESSQKVILDSLRAFKKQNEKSLHHVYFIAQGQQQLLKSSMSMKISSKLPQIFTPLKKRSSMHAVLPETLCALQELPYSFSLNYSVNDIQDEISGDQLGLDNHGKFSFNLSSWIRVQCVISSLEVACEEAESALSKIRRSVDSTDNVTTTSSIEIVKRTTFKCYDVMNLFLYPYIDPLFSEMENKLVFKKARRAALSCLQKTLAIQQQVEAICQNNQRYQTLGYDFTNSLSSVPNLSGSVNSIPTASVDDLEGDRPPAYWTAMKKGTKYQQIDTDHNSAVVDNELLSCLASKLLTFYHHFLLTIPDKLLQNRASLESFILNFLNKDFFELDIKMQDAKVLKNSLNQIEDFKVRNCIRLVIYRCSMLLPIYFKKKQLNEAILGNIISWKRHLDSSISVS